jgi:hypothetical protein
LHPAYILLLYAVIPVWLLAGFLDWSQHRRYSIETTSGPTESVLHLALLAEMGIPLAVVLTCEVSTRVFALLGCACLVHSLTAYIDTRYAGARRKIGYFEQMVHGYLEVLPYTALLLLATAHWEKFTPLFGFGAPDWTMEIRRQPLDYAYLSALALTAIVMVCIPFAEELQRGWRARRAAMTA